MIVVAYILNLRHVFLCFVATGTISELQEGVVAGQELDEETEDAMEEIEDSDEDIQRRFEVGADG